MTIDYFNKETANRSGVGLAGIDTERLKSMRNRQIRECFNQIDSMPYHREFVARVRGREYINDAASTNVNAAWYSLETVQGGLVWIAYSNGEGVVNYSRLVPPALRKVRQLIIVGNDARGMAHTFAGIVPAIDVVATMKEAVQLSYRNMAEDVKVLFSPANEDGEAVSELGEAFRHEVNEL